MKIGIDIHGVLDKNPFFKHMALAMCFNQCGNEVHIITGTSRELALKDLEKLEIIEGFHYTHLYSITDDLISRGIPVEWKDGNNPLFPYEEWDKAKAEYCAKNNIDIHFDDTVRYGDYFSTPFALVR